MGDRPGADSRRDHRDRRRGSRPVATSHLLACLGEVVDRGETAALVDTEEIFDPGSAASAGMDLRRLLWVRCGSNREVALRAADMLVRCPGFALVALDLGERVPRLTTTMAFRLKFAGAADRRCPADRRSSPSHRSERGAGVETLREGIEWDGPGPAPTRPRARTHDDARAPRSRRCARTAAAELVGAREPVRVHPGRAFRRGGRRAVRARAPRASAGDFQSPSRSPERRARRRSDGQDHDDHRGRTPPHASKACARA